MRTEWPLPPQSWMRSSMQVWWHLWINAAERTWEHSAKAIVSIWKKRETHILGHDAVTHKHVSVHFEMTNAWMWYYQFVMIRLIMINLKQWRSKQEAGVSCLVIVRMHCAWAGNKIECHRYTNYSQFLDGVHLVNKNHMNHEMNCQMEYMFIYKIVSGGHMELF